LSGYRPNDAGVLTHALIAVLAPVLPTLTDVTLSERLFDLAGAMVSGENVNRRRALAATATGHAAAYLRRFAPSSPWRLLGCEFDTGNGRVDLAWKHTVTNIVFYDEIKTTNRSVAALSQDWLVQANRYATAGRAEHGDNFAGVRLVPLGALHLMSLCLPDLVTRLDASKTEPLRLAGGVR
jgi:hypothetical protein